jgi:HK97 family phage major capsid protein
MDADTKTLLTEQMKTFESFKAANDTVQAEIKKLGEADVILREKVDRINAGLDKFEDMNQKLTLAQQQAKGAADKVDEIKEQADRIETAIKRSGAGGSVDKKVELKQLVNLWARGVVLAETRGAANLPAEYRKAFDDIAAEHKALTVGTDTTAGYLAPTEYVRDIIKGVTEMSPVRSVVRVRQTANKSIQIPKRNGQFAAQWVAETGTKTETKAKSTLIDVTIPIYTSYRFTENFALYASPKMILRNASSSSTADGKTEKSSSQSKMAGFTFGTMIGGVTGAKALALEITYAKDTASDFDVMQFGGAMLY